jgi:tyrosine-protein kinase Etk/Wzc
VPRLEVPEALVGVPLVLTADQEGGFLLASPEGPVLADGAGGRHTEGADAARQPVRILVSELVARPGTEFLVRKLRASELVTAP